MKWITTVLLALVTVLTMSAAGFASPVYYVSLDTSALLAHPASPFSLNFQFNDGAGVGNGNNTATLSGFDFGGGGFFGSPILAGGVLGDLGSVLSLTDSSFFNSFTQQFTPGSFLNFQLSLTHSVELGGTPDEFSFAILDNSGFELPYNPSFAALLVDIDNPNTIRTFPTDNTVGPFGGGDPINMPAPAVAAPEPGTFSLLLAGLGGIGFLAMAQTRRRGFVQ